MISENLNRSRGMAHVGINFIPNGRDRLYDQDKSTLHSKLLIYYCPKRG